MRLGDKTIVAASDEETGDEERALTYDSKELVLLDDAPAPAGMWAGRLGEDMLVTVGRAKEDGRMVRVSRVKVLLGQSPPGRMHAP